MALERKDVRFKLDANDHLALCVLADAKGVDLNSLVEQIVRREVFKQVHAATVIAERTASLGISGNDRD
jgi:hypothetical protein